MQTNLTLNFARYELLCMKNVFLNSKLVLENKKHNKEVQKIAKNYMKKS